MHSGLGWTMSGVACLLMFQDALAQAFPPSSRWYVREPMVRYTDVDGVSQSRLVEEKVLSVTVVTSFRGTEVPLGSTLVMVSESGGGSDPGSVSLYGREGEQTVFKELLRVPYGGELHQFPGGEGGRSITLVSPVGNQLGFEIDVSGTRYRLFEDGGGQYSQGEIVEAFNIDKFQPNLHGYDLVALSPRDFMEGNGQKNLIFEFQQYRKNPGGNPVPVGLEYLNLSCTLSGHSECQTVESSAELVRKTSSRVSVGAGAEFGGFKGQFAANAKFVDEAKRLSEGSAYYCMSHAAALASIYYLDRRGAKLTQAFINDVLSLVNNPGRYQWFVEVYGTHYAASVIYGGRADAMTRIDRQTQEDIDSFKRCLGGKVETSTVISLQASGDGCMQESDRLRQTLARETSTWQARGMTGGTESTNTQCQNPRSLVPVFMELRPIEELIKSPLFAGVGLEQAIQAIVVANGLSQYIDRYVEFQSQPLRSLMSDRSAMQVIDRGLQGCAAQDVTHRGSVNVVFRLPDAPGGQVYRMSPFLPTENQNQVQKVHVHCDVSAWRTFEQPGAFDTGDFPLCEANGGNAPCLVGYL